MVSRYVERSFPKSGLIMELCGRSAGLLSKFHHGLKEVPLDQFYPNLNLEELAVFAISSYDSRSKNPKAFSDTEAKDVYEIFNDVFAKGYRALRSHENMSPENQATYNRLNPFRGRNLRERLDRVNPNEVDQLKIRLRKPAKKYVFECEFKDLKIAGGDNTGLVIMGFMPYFPKKGEVAIGFAKEIARIMRDYPKDYAPLLQLVEVEPASKADYVQRDLFGLN